PLLAVARLHAPKPQFRHPAALAVDADAAPALAAFQQLADDAVFGPEHRLRRGMGLVEQGLGALRSLAHDDDVAAARQQAAMDPAHLAVAVAHLAPDIEFRLDAHGKDRKSAV